MQRRTQHGFTLIEIMVVVVILGILAALVVPQIMSRPDQAKVTVAKNDIKAISAALDMYKLDNYSYPSTQQGLEALVRKPSGNPTARNWNPDGYLKRLPVDPWGNSYQYLPPPYTCSSWPTTAARATSRASRRWCASPPATRRRATGTPTATSSACRWIRGAIPIHTWRRAASAPSTFIRWVPTADRTAAN